MRKYKPERSIPARAGEPSHGPGVCSVIAVYPRACGGTERAVALRVSRLSLPVYPRACGGTLLDTITLTDCYRAVYPRACGGTC